MSYHLFSRVARKARKQHRCIWCAEAILPTASYIDERSVYDGAMQRQRWHHECHDDAQETYKDWGDETFMPWSAERPKAGAGL